MVMKESKILFNFTLPVDAQNWFPVDDGVMGGVSASQIAIRPLESSGMLSFSGVVSLENYGGFASIRTRPERVDLSAYTGLGTAGSRGREELPAPPAHQCEL